MRPRQAGGLIVGLAVTFLLVVLAVPDRFARPERIAVVALVLYAAFAARKPLGLGDRPVATAPRTLVREALPEEQDVRLARLDASLVRAVESGEQYARVTYPLLRGIATERLRAKYGIDVTADPAGARRQMGEDLWAMYAAVPDPAAPPPAPVWLRDVVARLEQV